LNKPETTPPTYFHHIRDGTNKSQQMRWSRGGADLLLQVRCAVYNGTLGSGFGQKFHPANDPYPPMVIAA